MLKKTILASCLLSSILVPLTAESMENDMDNVISSYDQVTFNLFNTKQKYNSFKQTEIMTYHLFRDHGQEMKFLKIVDSKIFREHFVEYIIRCDIDQIVESKLLYAKIWKDSLKKHTILSLLRNAEYEYFDQEKKKVKSVSFLKNNTQDTPTISLILEKASQSPKYHSVIYLGNSVNKKKHGEGKLFYYSKDGILVDRFVGSFKNGNVHGGLIREMPSSNDALILKRIIGYFLRRIPKALKSVDNNIFQQHFASYLIRYYKDEDTKIYSDVARVDKMCRMISSALSCGYQNLPQGEHQGIIFHKLWIKDTPTTSLIFKFTPESKQYDFLVYLGNTVNKKWEGQCGEFYYYKSEELVHRFFGVLEEDQTDKQIENNIASSSIFDNIEYNFSTTISIENQIPQIDDHKDLKNQVFFNNRDPELFIKPEIVIKREIFTGNGTLNLDGTFKKTDIQHLEGVGLHKLVWFKIFEHLELPELLNLRIICKGLMQWISPSVFFVEKILIHQMKKKYNKTSDSDKDIKRYNMIYHYQQKPLLSAPITPYYYRFIRESGVLEGFNWEQIFLEQQISSIQEVLKNWDQSGPLRKEFCRYIFDEKNEISGEKIIESVKKISKIKGHGNHTPQYPILYILDFLASEPSFNPTVEHSSFVTQKNSLKMSKWKERCNFTSFEPLIEYCYFISQQPSRWKEHFNFASQRLFNTNICQSINSSCFPVFKFTIGASFIKQKIVTHMRSNNEIYALAQITGGLYYGSVKKIENSEECYPLKGRYMRDDTIYEGDWEGTTSNGDGKIFYPDGAIYTGKWSELKKNGEGVYHNTGGTIFYTGAWKNDIPHGSGTMFSCKSTISGLWNKGKKNGQMTICPLDEKQNVIKKAIVHYENGDKKNKLNAELYYQNGCIFKGKFSENDFTIKGSGIFKTPHQDVFKGTFENDIFLEGTIQYLSNQGETLTMSLAKKDIENGFFTFLIKNDRYLFPFGAKSENENPQVCLVQQGNMQIYGFEELLELNDIPYYTIGRLKKYLHLFEKRALNMKYIFDN